MPPVNRDTIEQATDGMKLIGYTVTWRLSGVRATYTDVVAALEAVGFNGVHPKKAGYVVALRRAIRRWVKERAASGADFLADLDDGSDSEADDDGSTETKRALIRRAKTTRKTAYHVFALVEEALDLQSLGLRYGTHTRILVHKGTKEVKITADERGLPAREQVAAQNEANEMTQQIGPIWEDEQAMVSTEEFTRLMRDLMSRCGAVSLREKGGMFFVPIARKDDLERVRAFLAAFDPQEQRTFLLTIGVPDAASTKKQVAKAATMGLMDEIHRLKSDLERTLDNSKTQRPETLEARLDDYQEMKLRIEAYSESLGFQQQQLLTELDELRTICRRAMLA